METVTTQNPRSNPTSVKGTDQGAERGQARQMVEKEEESSPMADDYNHTPQLNSPKLPLFFSPLPSSFFLRYRKRNHL